MRKERGPNRFLRSEATRAIKAAKLAGARIVEIDPATGKIRVFLGDQEKAAKPAEGNEWDTESYGKDAS
jgi:hypothetical protein